MKNMGDLKGGSWQCAGGTLQPPWLFRRKANSSFSAQKAPTFVYQGKRGFLFFYFMIDKYTNNDRMKSEN